MTFHLENGILGRASERVDAFRVDASRAVDYVEQNPETLVPQDARIFQVALRNHSSVVSTAKSNLDRARALFQATATNLDTADGRYAETEDKNSVEVQDIFNTLGSQDAGSGTVDTTSGTETTFGTDVASSVLTAPEEMSQINMVFDIFANLLTGPASIGGWYNTICGWVTGGPSPAAMVVEEVSGDWAQVGRAGDAFDKISQWWEQTSALFTTDSQVLFRGWTGDAADSAQPYFAKLAEAVAEQADAISHIGAQYVGTAWGMYFSSLTLAGLLITLIELIIVIAITAAACAVASLTGVGAISWSAVAAEVGVAIGQYLSIVTLIGLVHTAAIGFAGLCTGYLSTLKPIDQVPMP